MPFQFDLSMDPVCERIRMAWSEACDSISGRNPPDVKVLRAAAREMALGEETSIMKTDVYISWWIIPYHNPIATIPERGTPPTETIASLRQQSHDMGAGALPLPGEGSSQGSVQHGGGNAEGGGEPAGEGSGK